MRLIHYLRWYIEATSVQDTVQSSVIRRAIRERKTQWPYKMGHVGVPLGRCTLLEISSSLCVPITSIFPIGIFFLFFFQFIWIRSSNLFRTWNICTSYLKDNRCKYDIMKYNVYNHRVAQRVDKFTRISVCVNFPCKKKKKNHFKKSLGGVPQRRGNEAKRVNESSELACGEGVDLPKEAA